MSEKTPTSNDWEIAYLEYTLVHKELIELEKRQQILKGLLLEKVEALRVIFNTNGGGD